GAAEWHINSDEPRALDYNEEFKTANQITLFYSPDSYRSSDHDPMVVGLSLGGATPTNTPVPPTNTPVPPTNTPIPPTNTPVPPTNTPVPPTNTPIPPTNTPVPPTPTNTPVPGSDVIYVSSTSGGSAGGVSFADEDILSHDTGTGAWAMVFDGSDVGVTNDVNAFTILGDGSFLISFDTGTSVPGVGTVDDSDVVRFVPTTLGSSTSGTFEWYFDGSDVGLTTNGEDVDAVHVMADGKVLMSTTGGYNVSGASGADEDVIIFTPTTLGSATSGSWAIYFDGSDVGLNTSNGEDVTGTWDDGSSNLYLTTLTTVDVTGVLGDGADIFICVPGTLGATTSCTFSMYWDGSANGYGGERMDGLFIERP
ncbi:MAG: hypothetical protein KC419_14690, partial [Anaerolineales bacterium]|nr:hypothetical protein [Anaerolineales bacterium]